MLASEFRIGERYRVTDPVHFRCSDNNEFKCVKVEADTGLILFQRPVDGDLPWRWLGDGDGNYPFELIANEDGEHTGGSVNYYKVQVNNPTTASSSYQAECNDIIEALGMNYAEANVFKAVWRRCAARTLGKLKKGNNTLYDAEKMVFFAERVLAQEKRNDSNES